MIRYIGQRVALSVVMLWAVTVLIFVGTELLPGDVANAILGQQATPEALDAIRRELQLYDPALIRYLRWLGNLLSGDLGNSLLNNRPISEQLAWRLPNTLALAASAAVIAIPLAHLVGIFAAINQDGAFDRFVNSLCMGLGSLPEFFICYVLILVFAVQLRWFPSLAPVSPTMEWDDRLHSMFLPTVALALSAMTHTLRMTRAAIVGVMSQPYIEMAFLKGIPRRRVVIYHALPNALAPIVTVMMLSLAWLIAGVVVVEVVFVYPGVGRLMVDAVSQRDLPIVQACGLIFAATYIGLNLLADVLSILANPRLRFQR